MNPNDHQGDKDMWDVQLIVMSKTKYDNKNDNKKKEWWTRWTE